MARASKPDNVVAIGAALDAPIDAPLLGEPDPFVPDTGDEEDGLENRPRLPKQSPVRALGVGIDGRSCWYLNVQGQLVRLAPRDHGKNDINLLFTPLTHLPEKYWPRWSEEKRDKSGNVTRPSEIVGFKQDDASVALMQACGAAGIFDTAGRVRSRGAHAGKNGSLVLHTGNKIMVAGRRVDGSPAAAEWHDPGPIDGFVYPATAPAPRPHLEPVPEEAGERLLALLQTWRWKRPLLDAMLALGWAGQAYICGALDWRTHAFITGGRGTGKSTLNGKNGVFDRLLGKGAMRTGNATEAAVRQTLGAQTIPVIFDEFEATEFNPMRTKAIVELARVASSGAEFQKGGQDHNAHEFVLQSAFQFSAILMPEMQPQDRSRFAILELRPFQRPDPTTRDEHGDSPDAGIDLDGLKLPELGRQLMRRMVDGWPRFAETLKLYKRGLERVGHSDRGQATFGTLLACADLLLYDHLPDRDLVDIWATACSAESLAEIAHSVEEHDACITHLATSMVQARGGDERETIGSWIAKAIASAKSAAIDPTVTDRDAPRLEHIGLKLVNLRQTPKGDMGAVAYRHDQPGYLAVAGDHLGLSAIFRESRWQRGAWSQALGRVEGAHNGVKCRFDGRGLRATCIPLSAVLETDPEGAS